MSSLAGITVLEFSRVLAGPWCAMQLADLGAEVIKIESFDGDDTRGLGPPFKDGLSAYFACCNRNKKSLAIDLRAPAARSLIDALVRGADVVIENYRTGTAEALGVGYDAFAAINPRLVYCSISGYGRSGADAMRPGYDFAVQAEAGLMSITGEDAPRYGNAHASIVPYQAFRASDGQFVLAVASEKLWFQTCQALSRPDWLDNPDYRNNSARVVHRVALCAELAQLFASAPVAHWLEVFERASVPAAPINTVKQALDLPLVNSRGMKVELEGVPMIGSPLNLSLTPVSYRDAPPRLGQHSDEIVRRVGGDPAALRAAGVIR